MDSIEIRTLSDAAEFEQVEEIQRTTWNMPDVEVIPGRVMHALQRQGALVLGAIDDEQVVGFIFGILGTVEGLTERIDQIAAARLKMYSVIMGVLPAYQLHGVGYRLKLAQREFVLRIGVRLVTWTYDPLEARNARLNIGKLGAVCHHYWRNYHGDMGGLNAGLETDRFHVEWWVTSNRVKSRVGRQRRPLNLSQLLGGGAQLVNEVMFDRAGLPVPPPNTGTADGNMILVEIPYDFQTLKKQDMALAKQWRQHTRVLFESLFKQRYLVTDFATHEDTGGHRRAFYLLTHQSP